MMQPRSQGPGNEAVNDDPSNGCDGNTRNVPESFCPLSLDLIQLSPQSGVEAVVTVFKLSLHHENLHNFLTKQIIILRSCFCYHILRCG